MSHITEDDVRRVARLARLHLADEELSELTVQLGRIVSFVEQLNELDTTDVAPMEHVADITNVLREDERRPGLDREAALGNAPRCDADCFLVPAVLGENATD